MFFLALLVEFTKKYGQQHLTVFFEIVFFLSKAVKTKIDFHHSDFIRGMDVSSVISLENAGVLVDLLQQLGADHVRLLHELDDLGLHVGILLLADGEGAHHGAQGGADGAYQSGGAPAPRHGGLGGENVGKRLNILIQKTHCLPLQNR